ncbi:hypothetical protein, partial [Actinoplanes couchii]|uniref:hypothetical protein n=1 Tax=Actinoplanes couchii TaxID=403638 RepID=UPI00194385D0
MRVFRTILGTLLLTTGLPALLTGGGLWAAMQHRDPGGAFTGELQRLAVPGYAVVIPDIDRLLRDDAPFARFTGSRLHLSAVTVDGRAFLGIAPSDRVARYLAGVPYSRVNAVDIGTGTLPVTTVRQAGSLRPPIPDGQDIWTARGAGELGVSPETLGDRPYSLVVMNPAATPMVRLDTVARLWPGWLGAATWGLLTLGTLLLLAGIAVLSRPGRRRDVVYIVEPSQVPELMHAIGAPLPRPGSMPAAGAGFPGFAPGSSTGLVAAFLPASPSGRLPGSPSGLLPGSSSDSLPGSASGLLPGSSSGRLPGSASGLLPGSSSGRLPGSSPDLLPGSASDLPPGSSSGFFPGTPSNLLPGPSLGSFPGSPYGFFPGSRHGGAHRPRSLADSRPRLFPDPRPRISGNRGLPAGSRSPHQGHPQPPALPQFDWPPRHPSGGPAARTSGPGQNPGTIAEATLSTAPSTGFPTVKSTDPTAIPNPVQQPAPTTTPSANPTTTPSANPIAMPSVDSAPSPSSTSSSASSGTSSVSPTTNLTAASQGGSPTTTTAPAATALTST